MKIKAWAILTTGLADGYELTKSPARVQAARENGQTVVELVEKRQCIDPIVLEDAKVLRNRLEIIEKPRFTFVVNELIKYAS